jgi:Tat protein secretion system quality control protein TatD with DNase activity
MWTNPDIETDIEIIRNNFYKSVSFHRWYIANNANRIDKIVDVLVGEIGLDKTLTKNALDARFWTEQTLHERGHNLFDQFDVGYRLNI